MKGRADIRMQIELDDTKPASPGQRLTFNVHLFTNRPIEINSWRVIFRSRGHFLERKTGRTHDFNSDQCTQEQDFSTASTTIPVASASSGSEENANTRILHEGQGHDTMTEVTRQVTLRLPSLNVPDTWSYPGQVVWARVTNNITAVLSYYRLDNEEGGERIKRELRTSEAVTVKNQVLVEQLSSHGPVEKRAEESVGFHGWSGLIRCVLIARDQLALVGHTLPMVVQIDNGSSRAIRTVRLTLFKEYTFRELNKRCQTEPVTATKEKVVSVLLPSVCPHTVWHREIDCFTVPDTCQTSGSLMACKFVKVRFFVRLKVKWWFSSLKCDVDVYLGTRATRAPELAPSNLERYEIT